MGDLTSRLVLRAADRFLAAGRFRPLGLVPLWRGLVLGTLLGQVMGSGGCGVPAEGEAYLGLGPGLGDADGALPFTVTPNCISISSGRTARPSAAKRRAAWRTASSASSSAGP